MKRINDYKCPDCGKIDEFFWDIDSEEKPKCKECGCPTERMLAAPKISYQGAQTFRQKVPDGFKDVLKHVDKTTPANYKGGPMTAL